MANDDGAADKCWTGLCPECGRCVAIIVVPDESNTSELMHALRERRYWERLGYNSSFCTVGAFRSGEVPFRHADECGFSRPAKRAKAAATTTSLLNF